MVNKTVDCATDDCNNVVRPAAGYLGGDVLCLDCMEQQKENNRA